MGDDDLDPPGPGIGTPRVFDGGSLVVEEKEDRRGWEAGGVMEESEQRQVQRFLMILGLGQGWRDEQSSRRRAKFPAPLFYNKKTEVTSDFDFQFSI